MDRRRFLLTSLAGALVAPLAAGAQAGRKTPRIGVLQPGVQPPTWVEEFRQGLRELGYVEGQSIAVEHRVAECSAEQRHVIAEFTRLRVDVIVTWGMPAALAAKHETRGIPIVGIGPDPAEIGLTTSLVRLGVNFTELSVPCDERGFKTLRMLKKALPTISHVSLLRNPKNPAPEQTFTWFQESVPILGLTLLILEDGLLGGLLERIVDLRARHRLPVTHGSSALIVRGGLMSFGVVFPDILHEAAVYVDRILKGTMSADLSVELPTKYELIINMETARALGFTIPPSLLARADQVIE
jgi:putative ABC transport system substrate-binding protein